MSKQITKNELIAINKLLGEEIAGLRAQLSAAKVTRQAATSNVQRAERPLASFWDIKTAGEYITALKQRGAKCALTARRSDGKHFTVYAH